MLIGYARTSTTDQLAGLDAQVRDLKAQGCEKVFSERVSSVAQRDQLNACLSFLREGDTLVVTKPDRLARSTMDLLATQADLEKRQIGLLILSMGGQPLDTRNPTSKLMLTVLAGVATWEREIMLERQREGIARAAAEGKYKGRAPTAQAKAADVLRLASEGHKPEEIAAEIGIGRSSVYRILGNRKPIAREIAGRVLTAAASPRQHESTQKASAYEQSATSAASAGREVVPEDQR
jgi:DNA invertase Pin-like site-specific DNA recombinase